MSAVALIALAGLVAIASSSGKKASSKRGSAPPPAQCKGLSSSGGSLAGVDYLEIVTGGAEPNARLPMIVSLHGLGYDSSAHIKWLEQLRVPARIILPNGFYEKTGGSGRAWWPSYSNKAMRNASERLAQFVYLIQKCRPTSGRPIITGHSQGGYLAIDFASQFPELISYSVPVAGDRNSSSWDELPKVPLYPVHGTLDNSYASAFEYYNDLASRGLPVYLTAVEGGAHRLSSKNADAWRYVLEHLVGSQN
jgi:phospholipase/carboxylesterase